MIPKPAKGISSTVLLILIIVLAVASIPSATSQQFTTSTLIVTSSLTQTSTYTLTSTGTGTLMSTAEFEYLPGVCYFAWSRVFSSLGMTQIGYSISSPMILYILNGENLLMWTMSLEWTSNCESVNARISPPFYKTSIYRASGSLAVNLPASGNAYAVLLVKLETAASTPYPAAVLTISPVSGVYTATETISIPTQVLVASTSTLKLPFTQTYGTWIAVIVGALVLTVLFFDQRRSRHVRKPKQATLSQFAKSSCIKCGAELPPASEFCNKCGTKQTG